MSSLTSLCSLIIAAEVKADDGNSGTICEMEFCWICLVDYASVRRVGNAAHRRSCRYHTLNLRA